MIVQPQTNQQTELSKLQKNNTSRKFSEIKINFSQEMTFLNKGGYQVAYPTFNPLHILMSWGNPKEAAHALEKHSFQQMP